MRCRRNQQRRERETSARHLKRPNPFSANMTSCDVTLGGQTYDLVQRLRITLGRDLGGRGSDTDSKECLASGRVGGGGPSPELEAVLGRLRLQSYLNAAAAPSTAVAVCLQLK